MKLAIVHDYLREYGGAERVLEAMHEIWPKAPLYTSFVDWGNLGDWGNRFKDWDIRTSWVADNWLIRKFHSPLRFLAPFIWSSFDLSEYDLVISSSGWFMCRGVNARFQICYIHHPPRNLYGYATGSSLQKYWPVRVYATIINFFLRHYDFSSAQKVNYFIANSKETARRVKKFYRRESTVIYPPVDMSKVKSQKSKLKFKSQKYYLSVGRLTYSKRVDSAILAANKLKFLLKVVGAGQEEDYLRSIAGPTVEFLGSVSDETLSELYDGAKALLFCALDEDFGMVPVEAMAHGIPVIAKKEGGVLETVIDGKTGIVFKEDLIAAVLKFEKTKFQKADCVAQAQKFSKGRFQKELQEFVRVSLLHRNVLR